MVAARRPATKCALAPHALLAAFPDVSAEDAAAFEADVRAHERILVPVLTWRGWLVDGRRRLRAAQKLGYECPSEEWDGPESDLPALIVSLNLHRRHLSESQRAMIAAKMATAKVGDNQHTKSAGRSGGAVASIEATGTTSKTKAAELLNVGRASVERAKTVLEHGVPELVAAVERDRFTVSAAANIARMPEEAQREVLEELAAEARRAQPKEAARPARQANDPDKYLRVVKGGKIEARPFVDGEREPLGTFPTKAAARKAVAEYMWGRRKGLPKYVKRVHTKQGERYHALVPVFVGEFLTREEAAAAVEKWIRATFTPAAAESMLSRKET